MLNLIHSLNFAKNAVLMNYSLKLTSYYNDYKNLKFKGLLWELSLQKKF